MLRNIGKIKTALSITLERIVKIHSDLNDGIPVQDLSSFIKDLGKFLMTANHTQLTPDKITLVEDIFGILIDKSIDNELVNDDVLKLMLDVRGKAQWVGKCMESEQLPTNFYTEIGNLGNMLRSLSPLLQSFMTIFLTYQCAN